jgi:uncharacterized protein
MTNTSNLYRLQQIDTSLDQARSRLSEIDRILSDDTVMRAAEAEAAATEAELRQAGKELKEIEFTVQEQRTRIEQDESTLYSGRIRNPKELQDLQNEVSSLKRYLEVLEERLLETMLFVEEKEGMHNQTSQAVNQVRGRFEEQHAHLRAERSKLIQTIERLEVERQAAAGSIPPDDQALYEQLRKIRQGIAISRIIDRSCASCGSTLTPGVVQSASTPSHIVRCPSCGRILFPG